MKLVKSLLLGSAAGLAATTCGQAADLPFRKAAPVEYVRVCDWTGAGYFYIPGTDTCLKIGGLIRAEYEYNSGGTAFTPGVPVAATGTGKAKVAEKNAKQTGTIISGRNRDESGFFIRGRIDADARTQTAYGTLRTYVRYQIDRYSGAENFVTGTNPAGSSNNAYLDKGFIQFAGITAGRVQSFFDFGADPYGFEGLATSDASTQVLAYTQTFGGGFSATISMEDPNSRRFGIGQSRATAAGAVTNVAYSGDRIPDIVGQLNVTQAWGVAQLTAAYHQLNTAFNAPAPTSIGGKDDDGFAVRGAVLFKLPMLAAGDEFQVEGGYQQGATSYQDSNGISTGYGASPITGGLIHPNIDAIALKTAGNGGYTLAKAEGFSVSGGFVHFFTPNFNNIVLGSYEELGFGKNAKKLSWLNGGIGDATTYRIGDQINWFPVKDMQIGVEVMYVKVNQKVPGAGAAGTATGLPVGIKKDPDAVETRLRLERDF